MFTSRSFGVAVVLIVAGTVVLPDMASAQKRENSSKHGRNAHRLRSRSPSGMFRGGPHGASRACFATATVFEPFGLASASGRDV
jgi:hypothetical protein